MSCRAEREGSILPQACQLCVSRYTVCRGVLYNSDQILVLFLSISQFEIFFFLTLALCCAFCFAHQERMWGCPSGSPSPLFYL